MGLPISRHGTREILLYGTTLIAIGVGCWFIHPGVIAVPSLVFIWLISFFRDPNRKISEDPKALISPADGTITHIEQVESAPGQDEPALLVGIFLSVFNAHVNRMPVGGKITAVEYKEGAFHDARSDKCSKENERNDIVIETDEPSIGTVRVRQISGAIARRIICEPKVGDRLGRGERFGLIKFGSRTELYLPADTKIEWKVKVGDKIKAGSTVLGILG